ncbi:MAG: transcription-repair coupling factor [Verrucomicrobiaceae bacterium]|nr:transcription-repair coupling factor [Verrucomicrobiaceae bacterium]
MSEPKNTPPGRPLIEHTAASKPFHERLKQIGESPVVFDHIASPAQSFIAALVADLFHRRHRKNVWLLVDDLRSQERIAAEFPVWDQDALFFPEMESPQTSDFLPDQEIVAERLSVLEELHGKRQSCLVIIALSRSLDDQVPSLDSIESRKLTVEKGDEIEMDVLADHLNQAGYQRTTLVNERGQYSLRGGIIDIFSLQGFAPSRIEFFGNQIDSVREFDIDSQVSTSRTESTTIMLGVSDEETCRLSDYISPDDLLVSIGSRHQQADVHITHDAEEREGPEDFSLACHEEPFGNFDVGDFILQQARHENFASTLGKWHQQGWKASIFFHNEGEAQRFKELVAESGALPVAGFPASIIGKIQHGFTIPSVKLAVIAASELFGRYTASRARRHFNRQRKEISRGSTDGLHELTEGERVVHIDHGIGIYRELLKIDMRNGSEEDVIVIEYADQAKLYVPLEQAHLVSRYVGSGNKAPKLDKLGGGRWARCREKAERSILDYAANLLSTHAERETAKSYCHPPDTKWQTEFENSFIYRETADQIQAIEKTKDDMESTRPMDRLICGDVGFGKTEIAIRAAFKAVMGGKQVAFLCPTTVLAQQHFDTLRERFSEYPIEVDLLSRFRGPTQQRETLSRALCGETDIVVGTHRLISKDVTFHNLGLAIIDEEQRFGVKHKERFKEIFQLVDVLTLSATPIPRTLYLSLMGVKDMSTIDTAPAGRVPVETVICQYSEEMIRSAVTREKKRNGQVFFLHNRVKSIEGVKRKLEELIPGIRVAIGHGQMDEGMLEEVMQSFISGKIDVLVCTTIIESGIDIPNANTIIIDRADRFGLADLYQLRGRVGRAGHKAYALLMLPPDILATADARKRINAIRNYTDLGSGFKIAMRDLEIRGAGNMLGTQQSGHIAAVGFDLYCKLLRQSVTKLKGNTAINRAECSLQIDFICTNESAYLKASGDTLPAFLPASFLPEAALRINAYRQLSELDNIKELKILIRQWRDRFGPPPRAVDHLLRCTELKLAASGAGIQSVEIDEDKLMLTRNGQYVLIEGKFPRLKGNKVEERLKNALILVKKF